MTFKEMVDKLSDEHIRLIVDEAYEAYDNGEDIDEQDKRYGDVVRARLTKHFEKLERNE